MPSPVLSPWAMGTILSRKGWGLGSLHTLTHSSSRGLVTSSGHRSHASCRAAFSPFAAGSRTFPHCAPRVPAASVVISCRCLFKSETEVSGELVPKAHGADESPAEPVKAQFPGLHRCIPISGLERAGDPGGATPGDTSVDAS